MTARHRLSEEIVRVNFDFGVLSRQVILSIRFDIDCEVRKIVTIDANAVSLLCTFFAAVESDPNQVNAKPRVFRNRPIGIDHAEPRTLNSRAKRSSPFRVANAYEDFLVCQRVLRRRKDERACVQHLPGLIDWLVTVDENARQLINGDVVTFLGDKSAAFRDDAELAAIGVHSMRKLREASRQFELEQRIAVVISHVGVAQFYRPVGVVFELQHSRRREHPQRRGA